MRLLPFLILFAVVLAACSPPPAESAGPLPPGDDARGEELFNQSVNGAPACATCHLLDGTTRVGPGLQGFAAAAPTRQENMSAEEYAYTSITRPAAYLVSGFSNLMYNQYAQHLTPQQIADLIAYLLTL